MSRKASLQCTCTITVKRVYTVLYLAERENINVQKYKTYLKWQRKTIEDFNWNKKNVHGNQTEKHVFWGRQKNMRTWGLLARGKTGEQKNIGIACGDKTEEQKNMFFG